MTIPERTRHLAIPTVEIVFADVAHRRRFMESETSYHELYRYLLCDNIRADLGAGLSRRTRYLVRSVDNRDGHNTRSRTVTGAALTFDQSLTLP